jgi:hypothetical protein
MLTSGQASERLMSAYWFVQFPLMCNASQNDDHSSSFKRVMQAGTFLQLILTLSAISCRLQALIQALLEHDEELITTLTELYCSLEVRLRVLHPDFPGIYVFQNCQTTSLPPAPCVHSNLSSPQQSFTPIADLPISVEPLDLERPAERNFSENSEQLWHCERSFHHFDFSSQLSILLS